jgi:hypothetical protein
MEPIRQVSGKRSMLFFGLGAALAGAGFFLKPTKSRGPQGFGFRCGRANMSKFAVRTCCLLLVAGLFALGCRHSSSETGLTKVTLQADWYPQPEHGGFYTALAKGYYKDEGLDVTIQPGGPYVSMEKQVSVGLAQFGMSASDRTLEAVAGGQPLVAVAATMQRDPQGIMVRKDSPIHSFADFNGRGSRVHLVRICSQAFSTEQRSRNSCNDERIEFHCGSTVYPTGICDVGAVLCQ